MLIAECASCHEAPDGFGGYLVWSDAAPGNCSYAKTFNAFAQQVDLNNPNNSAIYSSISGGNPAHPKQYPVGDPNRALVLDFITDAANELSGTNGPVTPPPPPASPFDYAVFQAVIQPIIDEADNKGCSAANCHGSAAGIGGFRVFRAPVIDSQEMLANFDTVTAITNLTAPEQSRFYLQATTRHGGGVSALVNADEAAAILAWLVDAQANAAPGPGNVPTQPSPGCASAQNFSLSVFQSEIQPILFGEIDLNDRQSDVTVTGCSRGVCHGQDRTGGALVLKTTNSALDNLRNFACFVNFANPVYSDVLLCPSGSQGCSHAPHPGSTIFSGQEDLNYQRILSFIYASKTAATPIDFAFFARKVNPIFSDPSSVAGGIGNRACTDCHGVSVVGQAAPNGSDFPIIANASDKDRIAYNFSSAANFVNFLVPEGSSLFLYPTNEVANLDNPFASGLPHPGGEAFAVDSAQAAAILTWANGLRPDRDGFLRDWLVAGDFSAFDITDITSVDEVAVAPKLFDRSGAPQFNNGEWDGFFSDDTIVDLNQPFPRSQTAGRVAYAVAYVTNITSSPIQAQITVTSNNSVKLYVGSQPIVQAGDAAAGVTGLAVFPPQVEAESTRLMVKLLQAQNDADFSFTVRLQDQFGNLLTDATGELIIRLSPEGGI